ncbi:MAG: chromosome segregation protein SMC, partial [Thermoplasmata archaeon]
MENFKSFGKRVVIPFFPGFTAITGPNGSGKSNIGDAIRFVLGPKSPKSIRAERLTDLIFNGGKDKKKAANYCEVSLVFDNKDRKLPIDSDTVVLTRRIKRAPLKDNPDNFYSYFYINGRSASLTDFVNLLTRARISGDGYNIVKQGDVTSLVEMGPVERRRIIDDIAGISEFDRDLERAEKEKKEVEENIQRINIILDEINRQLNQLKKERDEAIRYKELQEKLYETKAKIAYKKKLDIEEQIAELQRQIESYEKEKEKLEKEREEKKRLYEKSKEKLEEIEKKIAESGGEEAKRVAEKISILRTEIAKMEERISNIKSIIRSLSQRKADSERSLEEVNREASELDNEIKRLSEEIEHKQKEEENASEEINDIRENMKESDKKSIEISRELAKLREEYENLMQRRHELELDKERLNEKIKAIETRLNELQETKKTYEFEVKDSSWRIEEARKEQSKLIRKKESLERGLFEKRKEEAEINQQLRELDLAIRNLQREYSRLRAEYEANESLRKGYTTAVLKILEARDKGELEGIHGTVAELAKVDPKYEIALQVAGGQRLQAIIVDNDEVAAKAIEYLRKNKFGRATFLPLNKMISGKPRAKALLAVEDEKSHGFAMDLISFRKEYESAFWYVFGDTVVVEDLDTARKWMGGVRLVTLQGDLIEASGAMIGGVAEKTISFSPADRSKLDEIEEKLRKAMESHDALVKRLDEIRKEIEELQ